MACSKCKKRKFYIGRTIKLDSDSSLEGEVVDENFYQVQSRMHTVVSGSKDEGLRFLPGERVNMVGTLLHAMLSTDHRLFIFIIGAEKRGFVSLHPMFEGVL